MRGQLVLIVLVGTALSLLFWAVGEPYFILVAAFAGIVEIVPVLGPIAAGALAVGVGFTSSWHVALAAGICVLVVRLLEDYLIIPRVLVGVYEFLSAPFPAPAAFRPILEPEFPWDYFQSRAPSPPPPPPPPPLRHRTRKR